VKEIEYVIQDEVGIHARPAGQLVSLAKGFTCSIRVQKMEKDADAKSILGIMGLGVNQGDTIKVVFQGVDEDDAYSKVSNFLLTNL